MVMQGLITAFNGSIYGRAFANVAGIDYLAKTIQPYVQPEINYWNSPRGEYEIKSFMTALPLGFGDFFKMVMTHDDSMQEMDEALNGYGLGYEDIKYMSKTLGFRSGGSLARSGLNFVSSNLGRLYR